jgi:hypothetical protein
MRELSDDERNLLRHYSEHDRVINTHDRTPAHQIVSGLSRSSWSLIGGRPPSLVKRPNADWDFLRHLHDMGRTRADQWLEANFDRLGIESTVDLDAKYF